MRSRMLQLSLVMAIVVSVALTIAVALEQWTLATALGAVLVSSTLLVAADANRQARLVRRKLLKLSRAVAPARDTPEVEVEIEQDTPEDDIPIQTGRADMLGAVRVLQAQYTARLDHLQASLDEAVADLRSASDHSASDRSACRVSAWPRSRTWSGRVPVRAPMSLAWGRSRYRFRS